MKHAHVYMAINEFDHAFICIAYSKKQIKAAGLNMRLPWERKADIKAAKAEIEDNQYTLLHTTDVTKFVY
jgi:hypothetical protein